MQMMDRFMQDTYVIPPSEWDPSIRIEPPPKYTSKVKLDDRLRKRFYYNFRKNDKLKYQKQK